MQIPLPIIAALTGALVGGFFSLMTLILVLRNERRKRREEDKATLESDLSAAAGEYTEGQG